MTTDKDRGNMRGTNKARASRGEVMVRRERAAIGARTRIRRSKIECITTRGGITVS